MSKRRGVFLFLAFAVLFLPINRAAYQGWFQDDEIDNISWTRFLPVSEYLLDALTPRYFPNNFRPVGHFYFRAAEAAFGLDFPGYVAVIHAIHLLNVWLLWMLARRLGATPLAAAAACLFLGLHMALFDNMWKPMYVFDLLCATFSLTCLLLYAHGRWLLSFAAFWLAYKSKELAVMLPLVLACYEYWFGQRRWKPLVPFFIGSLLFGIQSLLLNPNRDNDYTFRFTLAALARTSTYYASRIFLVPYAGFAILLTAWIARSRRTWFGLAMFIIFFMPLLFLPGRMFSAYCYLPFTGLAIALTGLPAMNRPVWVAIFFLAWLPVDYRELRARRNETLARDAAIRTWMTTVGAYVHSAPPPDVWIYSGAPEEFHQWGIEGSLRYFLNRSEVSVHSIDSPESQQLMQRGRAAVLTWDPVSQSLNIQ